MTERVRVTKTTIGLFIFAATLLPGPTPTAHARNDAIAVEGTQAHGLPAGVLFGNDLSLPVIEDSGNVAYKANLTGNITADNDQGIWRDTILQVRKGDNAPGTPADVFFVNLGDPLINDSNRITHRSDLTGNVTNANDQGIWQHDFSFDFLIAREGDPVNDLPGVTFTEDAFHDDPAVHEDSSVSYYAATFSGPGIGSNDRGIFRGTTLEIQEGDVAADTGGAVFVNFGAPISSGSGNFAHRSFLQFGGNVDGSNNEGIWRYGAGTATDTLIAREGDQAPDTPAGVVFSILGEPTMNASQVAHLSFLTGTGITADNDRGIWVDDVLIAREGSQAPGLPSGVNYRLLGTPVINDLGQVAHQSDLQTGGLVNFQQDAGIWRNDTLIAREGSPAPGIPGALFTGSLGDPVLNNIGIVAHNSDTSASREGIWLSDGIDHILAVREDDILEGRTVKFLTLLDPATISDGRGSPLNDLGQLAYLAQFDDDTRGVFRFTPELHWRGTTPAGDWDDAANWTLGIRPSFVHDIVIDPDHDVTIDGPDLGSFFRPDSVTVGGGGGIATVSVRDMLFDPDAPLTVDYNGHLIIRDTATLPTANVDLGVALATPTDAPATLTIIGPTADMDISGATNIGVNAPAILNVTNGTYASTNDLNIGVSSEGTLNILTTAGAEVADPANLGLNPTGHGTLNVDGPGSNILFNMDLNAGIDGDAHINVTDGGYIDANDGLILATGADSTSTITVQGHGSEIRAGYILAAEAGHATITVQDGATLDVNSQTYLGTGPTGTALLTITGSGTTYETGGFFIGEEGTATVTASNGAQVISGETDLGLASTANGYLTITGPNTVWNADIINVGFNGGDGTLLLEDGATLTSLFPDARIGHLAASVATATVTDPGTSWSATGPLHIGDNGGLGTLNILNGALVSFPNGTTTINDASTVHIDGGTFTTKALAGTGDLHLVSGTLNLTDTTTFDNTLFDPNLTLGPDTAINVVNDAILSLSNLTLAGGNLTANTATINGTLTLDSGLIQADGGVDNSGEVILGSATTARIITDSFDNLGDLSGAGRISGDLDNTGTIDAPGGTLRFDDTVANRAGGIITLTGGQLRVSASLFNLTSALVLGNGTLRADAGIFNENMATMAFSGLTNILGDVTNDPGALIISSGGGPVTFFDDVINNGEIKTSDASHTVFLGDYSGAGDLTAGPLKTGTVSMEGDVNPGNSPAEINFGGNLAFGSNANLNIELGGLTPGTEHDKLVVAGNATLTGTLDIDIIDTFDTDIVPFDAFTIMTWGDNPDDTEFDTVNFTAPVTIPGISFDINYNEFDLTIEATALGGDANLDGTVDLTDLTILAINFETPESTRRWRKADFNNDHKTDLTDLTILAINFGSTFSGGSVLPGPGADIQTLAATVGLNTSGGVVPEPTSLLTLIVGVLISANNSRPRRP